MTGAVRLQAVRFFWVCCVLGSCSFEDRVDHCTKDSQCNDGQECYRGFCIRKDQDDAPDASSSSPSTASGGKTTASGGKTGSTSSASTAAGAKAAAAGTKAAAAGSGGTSGRSSGGAGAPATPAADGGVTPGQMPPKGCQPEPEQCNGVDDDCNGVVDENIVLDCFPDNQTGCTKQSDGHFTCAGVCTFGKQTCSNGKLGECTGYKAAAMEVCTPVGMQAADESCNGMTDEGCACMSGETRSCYSGRDGSLGVGICKAGTQACSNGALGACMDAVAPGTETCANQGADDDCDGKPDNIPSLGTACVVASASGPCRIGIYQCAKTELSCVSAAMPAKETCNNIDDDCNGVVDDTFDLMNDAKNCGACGKTCSGDEACCSGSCVATKQDANNCGACGMKCAAGATCNGGKCKEPDQPPPPPMDAGMPPPMPGSCQPACAAGQTCCNGSCVDTKTDAKQCGACGNACSGAQPGCCDGKCVDLVSNGNCGQCGRDCSLLTNGNLTCTCTKMSNGTIACTGPLLNLCL